ncbi:hypothetical protein [Kutzneria albida]|uniref:hypothetical protein n=1 Tax=Kutzneria albida TaxID=43357 RepID=UPI00046CC388|nr:hypothetical protein [Kutzneria albida]
MNDTYWSLGVTVGLPIAGFISLLATVGIVVGVRYGKKIGSYEFLEPSGGLIWTGSIALFHTLLITGIVMFPWTAEYHQWRPVGGTLSEVQSRLISAGSNGGSNQKFAVRFTGSKQEYSCEDTRCALLKPRQHLELSCIREWQYAGTPGYACQYVRSDGDQ